MAGAQDADGVTDEFEEAMHKNQARIDSLITLLISSDESPEKVDIYIKLSNEYLQQDYNTSLKYAKEGLTLAFKIEDLEGILDCHMTIAYIHLAFTLDLQAALSSYEDALQLAQDMGRVEDEMIIYRGISNVYGQLGNYDAAEDYMTQALKIAEEMNDESAISSINAYLGSMFEEDGDTTMALVYYKAVYEIEQRSKFENASNPSLITIAHYHFLTGDIKEAIRFYRIALKRFQRDLDNRWLSYTHSMLANLYLSTGNFERAEAHAINGLSIAQHYNLTKEITDNYHILIDIADSLGKPELADRYKKAFEAMQARIREDADLLNAKVNDIVIPESKEIEQANANSGDGMNRFLMAILISLPVVLLILFMSMPARSQR